MRKLGAVAVTGMLLALAWRRGRASRPTAQAADHQRQSEVTGAAAMPKIDMTEEPSARQVPGRAADETVVVNANGTSRTCSST